MIRATERRAWSWSFTLNREKRKATAAGLSEGALKHGLFHDADREAVLTAVQEDGAGGCWRSLQVPELNVCDDNARRNEVIHGMCVSDCR